jgi:hypothetical protein
LILNSNKLLGSLKYVITITLRIRYMWCYIIKQKHNETTVYYLRRFRDNRNRCFNLNIFDKDLTDLAYSGLSSHLKVKLESHAFSDVRQVLQRALDCKSWAKESRSFPISGDKSRNECHINMVEYNSESSDDEDVDMCVVE